MLFCRRFSSVSGLLIRLASRPVAAATLGFVAVYNPSVEPRLRLLGSPRLEPGDETIGAGDDAVSVAARDLPVDKPAALIYYLAVRGDWVRRAELAYLVRPDAPERVALANVRVLLHRAKSIAPSELEVERGRVRWRVDTDVADFRASIGRRDDALALALYRGPFLDGVSVPDSPGLDTWLELERSNLSQQWRHLALAECTRLQRSGAVEAAADLTSTLVTADPLDEEALQHRCLDGVARILALLAPGPPPPRGSRAKPKRPGRRR